MCQTVLRPRGRGKNKGLCPHMKNHPFNGWMFIRLTRSSRFRLRRTAHRADTRIAPLPEGAHVHDRVAGLSRLPGELLPSASPPPPSGREALCTLKLLGRPACGGLPQLAPMVHFPSSTLGTCAQARTSFQGTLKPAPFWQKTESGLSSARGLYPAASTTSCWLWQGA